MIKPGNKIRLNSGLIVTAIYKYPGSSGWFVVHPDKVINDLSNKSTCHVSTQEFGRYGGEDQNAKNTGLLPERFYWAFLPDSYINFEIINSMCDTNPIENTIKNELISEDVKELVKAGILDPMSLELTTEGRKKLEIMGFKSAMKDLVVWAKAQNESKRGKTKK